MYFLLRVWIFWSTFSSVDSYRRKSAQSSQVAHCWKRCRQQAMRCNFQTLICEHSRKEPVRCPRGEVMYNGQCLCPQQTERDNRGFCVPIELSFPCEDKMDNVQWNDRTGECGCLQGYVPSSECRGRVHNNFRCKGCVRCEQLKPNTQEVNGECRCIPGYDPGEGFSSGNSVGCSKLRACASQVCPHGMSCIDIQGQCQQNSFGRRRKKRQTSSDQSIFGDFHDGQNEGGIDADPGLGFGSSNTGTTSFNGGTTGQDFNAGGSQFDPDNQFGGNQVAGSQFGGANQFGGGSQFGVGGNSFDGQSNAGQFGQTTFAAGYYIPQTDLCRENHVCRCMRGKFDAVTFTCREGSDSFSFCDNCPPGMRCIRDHKAVGGYRCQCSKYAMYNYETYRCDCMWRHHGPSCECKHTQWWDKRYKVCRSVTKAVWRMCQFNMKCGKVKHSYCQAIGPKEAACTCDSGYKLKVVDNMMEAHVLQDNPMMPTKKVRVCIRDYQGTTLFTREQSDIRAIEALQPSRQEGHQQRPLIQA